MGQGNDKNVVIGVDLGGTFTKAGLVDPEGRIRDPHRERTDAPAGRDHVVQGLFRSIDHLIELAETTGLSVRGIGIAVTGQVDPTTGTVIGGLKGKIPGWIGVPLKSLVQARYDMPVVVENDGKAAAVGEHRFGAAKGYSEAICLTIGTGVGGGLIIGGRLHRKWHGAAGELGHVSIDYRGRRCDCGNRGCLELYVSAPRLIGDVMRAIRKGEPSVVTGLVRGELDRIDGEVLRQAADMGDDLVLKLLKEMAARLGAALSNLAVALGPQVIVIGGGIAEFGEMLLELARKEVLKRAFGVCADGVKIVQAALGEYSGAIGVAALVFDELAVQPESCGGGFVGCHRDAPSGSHSVVPTCGL
ncbi:MAG: ROK family protein [Bacteroidota bacterium]